MCGLVLHIRCLTDKVKQFTAISAIWCHVAWPGLSKVVTCARCMVCCYGQRNHHRFLCDWSMLHTFVVPQFYKNQKLLFSFVLRTEVRIVIVILLDGFTHSLYDREGQ